MENTGRRLFALRNDTMKKIDWKYPFMFGVDLKSNYKSLWLGWWLVTWTMEFGFGDFNISFQPGL